MKSRLLSLAGDTFIYGIFILIGRFLTFLLTPFYTNFLTVEEVGDVGNFFAIIAFVNVLYALGMDAAFFRFYSKDNLEQSKLAFTYSYLTIALSALLFTILSLIFSNRFSDLLTNLPEKHLIVKLAILVPFTDSLMVVPYAFLRMTRKVVKFSLIRFSLIIIAVGLNIYFVVILKIGIKGVFYAQLIANIIGVLIFIPIVAKLFLFRWESRLFADMLRFGLPTVPATFSGIFLQLVDRPILKYLANAQQVGIYMVNYRLAIPMMLFVAMYDYAWRPFYLTHFESSDAKELFARIFKYFVFFSGFIFLANAFFIEYIIRLPFFGGHFIEPSYWEGLDIVPIVMLGFIFNGFYINFTAGINIRKQTKYLPVAVGISAIANILLNFLLIPFFGYRGSAWANLFAYLLSALVIYYYSQKVYPIIYNWTKIIKLIVITFTFFSLFYYYTYDFTSELKFVVRLVGLISFCFIPFLFGIFTFEERKNAIGLLRNFFVKKHDKN